MYAEGKWIAGSAVAVATTLSQATQEGRFHAPT
jgi:hypothetical protein